jgi:hypothetical protein
MEEFDKKVEEIQQVFKEEILAGNFKKVARLSDEYEVCIIVSGKYPFIYWIANGPEYIKDWEACHLTDREVDELPEQLKNIEKQYRDYIFSFIHINYTDEEEKKLFELLTR